MPSPATPYQPAEIHADAEAFRNLHAPGVIGAIELDAIIEFGLKMELRPVRHLLRRVRVRACVAGNGRTVWVDNALMRHEPEQTNEALAHEIAHAQLHSVYLPPVPFSSLDDVRRFHASLGQQLVLRLENEADEWAGRLLLPRRQLKMVFDSAYRSTMQLFADLLSPSVPFDVVGIIRERISWVVAQRFAVTPALALRWIEKDCLWTNAEMPQAGGWPMLHRELRMTALVGTLR